MPGKPQLRRELLARRGVIGTALSSPLDPSSLLTALGPSSHGVIASYVPVRGEPGFAPLPGWLLPVLLPDGDLDWATYGGQHDGQLAPGPYGLQEPVGRRLGVDAIATATLVLVPALAVSVTGVRLGRGGGSYDRALPRATGLVVAVADVLVPELPVEPHDVPVDAALVDGELIFFRR